MTSRLMAIVAILPLFQTGRALSGDCSKEAYDGCIRVADPLVKETHLVFPDNMNDIKLVCQTWDRFIDCLKFHTDNCFNEQQRRQFKKAVENPIDSVHQMCTQPNYQEEYLQYAPCIKNTITERNNCGQHYNLLVDQVSQGEIISKSTLCCSYNNFKQCVVRETRRLCDRGNPDGSAVRFATQIIEKALSFLQDQCNTYIPNSGDCSIMATDSTQAFSDPLTISSSSSEIYPWSTIQQPELKDIAPSRVTPPRMVTATSWLPSSTLTIRQDKQSSPSSDILGARSRPVSRPASYGRASTWYDEQPSSAAPSSVVITESVTRPVSNWRPSSTAGGAGEASKATIWYPAAGDQLGNEVDEPNQQGWKKPKNGSGRGNCVAGSLIWLSLILGKLLM